MKYEIKVYKDITTECRIRAVIRNAWFKYSIDPTHLKYKSVYFKNVDNRFDCDYWFSETNLKDKFNIDISTNTLKDIAIIIRNAIENIKNKIDHDIKNKNINIAKCKEEKYITKFEI